MHTVIQATLKARCKEYTPGDDDHDKLSIDETSLFFFLDAFKHDNGTLFANCFSAGDKRLPRTKTVYFVTYEAVCSVVAPCLLSVLPHTHAAPSKRVGGSAPHACRPTRSALVVVPRTLGSSAPHIVRPRAHFETQQNRPASTYQTEQSTCVPTVVLLCFHASWMVRAPSSTPSVDWTLVLANTVSFKACQTY